MGLISWPISANIGLRQYPSDNPLTQHQDCPNPLLNKNLQMMKKCRWNTSRCSYVVRKCISIYRQSFSQMTAMMMVVMMRAQIFFKDMFVFSGTSVWYVFSTMEPNPLQNKQVCTNKTLWLKNGGKWISKFSTQQIVST